MRHRVKGKALSRNTKQRQALFKGMLKSLFEEGAIETTEAKAKVIRRLADKVISKAKPGTLNARRTLEHFFGSKQIVNRIVDGVAPALKDRKSGFTTLTRLGRRRGDDSSMVKLELVSQPIEKEVAETAKKVDSAKKVETKAGKDNAKKSEKTAKVSEKSDKTSEKSSVKTEEKSAKKVVKKPTSKSASAKTKAKTETAK